jgi:hypothetical protein
MHRLTKPGNLRNSQGLSQNNFIGGIDGSGTFVNYAIWESAAQFRKAVKNIMNPQKVCIAIQGKQTRLIVVTICKT